MCIEQKKNNIINNFLNSNNIYNQFSKEKSIQNENITIFGNIFLDYQYININNNDFFFYKKTSSIQIFVIITLLTILIKNYINKIKTR